MELDSSSTSAGSDGKLQTFLHSGDALAQRFRRAHLDALDGVTSLCGSLAQLERLNSLPQCTSNTPATAGTASPGSSFRERTFEALVRRINDAVESVHAHLGSLRSVVGSLEKLHATFTFSDVATASSLESLTALVEVHRYELDRLESIFESFTAGGMSADDLQAQWRVLRFLQAKDVQEVDDDLATAIGGL